MSCEYQIKTPDFVTVSITTSNSETMPIEKRFPKSLTIFVLKNKLELITGGNATTMKLEIYDHVDKYLFAISSTENDKLLGSFPIDSGMRLNVVDNFQFHNQLNCDPVPKFELSNDEYSSRKDSLKAFLMKNKLGKYSDKIVTDTDPSTEEDLSQFKIGSRCKVSKVAVGEILGTVMFVGCLKGRKGNWIGVKLDEPLGTCDGTFNEIQYFETLPKYGDFVRTKDVQCGDYPECDYGLDDLDEL